MASASLYLVAITLSLMDLLKFGVDNPRSRRIVRQVKREKSKAAKITDGLSKPENHGLVRTLAAHYKEPPLSRKRSNELERIMTPPQWKWSKRTVTITFTREYLVEEFGYKLHLWLPECAATELAIMLGKDGCNKVLRLRHESIFGKSNPLIETVI